MDRLRRPRTSEATSPEPKRQRRVPQIEEPFALVRVDETDSDEWGNASLAAARASQETTVNPKTERLIRTFHPSLGPCPVVYVMESDKNLIWVVIPGNFVIPTTHAAGREIHVMPGSIIQDRIMKPPFHDDPLGLVLNPRRVLSQDHLDMLRDLFPTSIGARVFISGCIVVLFTSRRAIERSWFNDGFFVTFGSLRLFYDVVPPYPLLLRVADWFARAGLALSRFIPFRSKLPSIGPDETPRVVGRKDYETALNGGRLFALLYNDTSSLIPRPGRVSPIFTTAIAEGCEYREAALRSLLWRTENDGDSVEISGLGDLAHKMCLAICLPLLSWEILKQGRSGRIKERDLTIRIQGGHFGSSR